MIDLTDVQFVSVPIGSEGERTKIQFGDVVLTITADLGRVGLVEEDLDAYVNQHVALIRLSDTRSSYFVAHYLRSEEAQQQLGLRNRGVTRAGLGLEDIKAVVIPFPPSAEQRRIVAKLELLKDRLSCTKLNLVRSIELANKLRRTALKSAFSGDLTRDVRPFGSKSSTVAKPDLDNQERGSWLCDYLPQSWRWTTFDDFFEDWTDSKRKVAEEHYLSAGQYPVIDQGKKFIGGFSDDESVVQRVELPAIVFGDHTRCVKFVEQPFIQGADGTKVLKAKPGIEPRFAFYALLAIEIPAKGYSRHMKFVRKSLWPCPPLDEQCEIVRRLQVAFARADRLEAETARSTKLLNRLEATILTKAFRGELAPQDPADEPASIFLDRSRVERASAPKRRRGRGSAMPIAMQ